MKRNQRIISVCFLAALTASVGVAQEKDLEGSKDHPLVSRYPGSVIVKYSYSEFDEVMLPLGKANNKNEFDKSLHLEGKVTRIGYEAPAHRSILELYRNYESALLKSGFQVLWSCANNEGCGSTGPTQLASAGEEDWSWSSGQRYLTAKSPRSTGDAYVGLHVGQWSDPNRGASVVLYVVELKPMEGGLVTVDAAALASDITATGHSAVYGIYFDTGKAEVKPESDGALKEIAKLLQQDARLKLLVVGHTDGVGTLASNMDLSKRRADAVVQVLTGKYGVAPARLSAQGAGPLAPVASNKSEEGRAKNRRVELVEQ
jgi:outer membrane protein OmpA-like peptidoglycan-associated protein